MEIMVVRRGYIEEVGKIVKDVAKKYCVKKFAVEAHTGVLIAKNN